MLGLHLYYAYLISFQVTALPLYGGILFPSAIGAVVVGLPTTSQTPLSGQFSPVLAVVPNGFLDITVRISYISEVAYFKQV